jgi:hypothetical protein
MHYVRYVTLHIDADYTTNIIKFEFHEMKNS